MDESALPKLFARDPWERPDGSFGLTTCLEEGALVEKGAASVSIIHGVLTEVINPPNSRPHQSPSLRTGPKW